MLRSGDETPENHTKLRHYYERLGSGYTRITLDEPSQKGALLWGSVPRLTHNGGRLVEVPVFLAVYDAPQVRVFFAVNAAESRKKK